MQPQGLNLRLEIVKTQSNPMLWDCCFKVQISPDHLTTNTTRVVFSRPFPFFCKLHRAFHGISHYKLFARLILCFNENTDNSKERYTLVKK